MASNDGKIGCTTGRAKIIDPNDFNGFNSDSNVPVQLEDLNISVILTTYKKPRTNLTTTSDGSTFESSREFRVNFIEGTNLGGKKVLTTKYTDLTTSFEKGAVNEETLGITNIDIEFNSSMAPMVAISFIDVRGSSIFQNEENILNGYNKYSVFFQLPYPLFELEIKGYYGKPVKYCLHMLKFNSKFNSQTGNFEITCNFIGYSYALLSDTLLGYLKAIPYTKIGEERYTAYNSTRNTPILNLNELMKKIDDINKNLPKIADSAPESVEFNSTTTALDRLTYIKDTMDTFAESMPELNTDKENHDYIVFKTIDLKTKENEIKIYKDDVTKYIESDEDSFNKLSETDKLDVKTFTSLESNNVALGAKVYKRVTKKMFTSNTDATLTTALGTQNNLEEKKQKISEYLKKNYSTVGEDEKLDIIDFSLQYEELNKKKNTTEKANESAKKALAKKFEESVRDTLGFDPTVREIVEIFTAAIEVFIETIYVVSTTAEGNSERTEELAKKFTATGSQGLETDIYNANIELKKFFPWPDYREKDDEKNTYVEKYLGASGVLESPEKVDELVFIEDLLNAFRKAKKIEDAIVENQDTETTAWLASNPLDSIVFSDKEPYSRYGEGGEFKTREDFVRLLLIRGMTFLGYSNDPAVLQPEEIKAMGEVEAAAILRGVKTVDTSSGTLKQSLTKITLDFIKDVEGTINGNSRKVIEKAGSDYKYTYIYNGNEFKLIPVNKGFNNENWGDPNKEYLQVLTDLITKRDVDEYLFLTNYSDDYTPVTAASKPVEESKQRKNDDGGTYVKFFKGTEFPAANATVTLPEGVTSDNVMILENLKKDAVTFDAGFNSFAGGYGAQDFSVMDWGNEDLTDLALMYVFYNDYQVDNKLTNMGSGLAYTRKKSGELKGKDLTTSKFDLKTSGNITVPKIGDTLRSLYLKKVDNEDVRLHADWGKNRILFNNIKDDSVSYPYVVLKYDENKQFSLFGSELYYNQSFRGRFKNYNRALLFLHSLPFNKIKEDTVFTDNPFGPNEITHLFDSKAGFVHAPRLWCAYIGGILWRQSGDKPKYDDSGTKIIGGGSGSDDPIAWNVNYADNNKVNVTDTPAGSYSYLFEVPNKNTQYLPSNIEFIGDFDNLNDYVKINKQFDIWPNLPRQIKNAFKKTFFDFVNGEDGMTSFDEIRNELEIYNGTGDQFHNYLGIIRSKIKDKDTNNPYISASDLLNSQYLNIDVIKNNYERMVPLSDKDKKFFMFLEIKDGSEAASKLKTALTEEYVIANNSYAAWVGSDAGQGQITRKPIKVSSTNFDLYFKSLVDALKKEGDDFSPTKEKENLDISIFGTANKDLIRLNLYRTCKNIYDKWLGGANDVNKVMYQCGGRSSVDAKLASKYENKATKFIDSFRFVSRSFRDIGDKLYINPLPINDWLIGNPNTSSYDAISSLLAANNFEFQALPNFINFNNDETLKAIFKPYSYYDKPIEEGICGPSFVCVYVGQTSKHLDFRGGEYPNDGFDLRCINGSPSTEIPPDFNEASNDYEDAVGAFTVRYSQQNQNIFKDINLDQSEFSETDESLQIQDDISQKGAENNRSFVGQNIYNVYAVRSYSAEIEMMGNAMIQPMMYFQLDNIPMFHGAYMVTRVKHSIKPNSMSTNFKGVRIRYPETPLITAYDIYMDLISTLDTSGAGTGTFGSGGSGGGVKGTFAPIVVTLIENGAINGKVEAGNNKLKPLPKIEGVDNAKLNNKAENLLIQEAVDPFVKMVKDWIGWMKQNGFKGNNGYYVDITSIFRDYEKQVQIKKEYGSAAAAPGSSNHGWAIALDFQFYNKKGTKIPNTKNQSQYFKFDSNPAIKWIYDNSWKYGWVMPSSLRDGSGLEEHWHIEYHGTAAKCIIEKNPTIYGYTVNIDKNAKIDASVKNPKTKDGKEAVYNSCDYKFIEKAGDGTEGGGGGKAAFGCKSPNYSFPFQDPLPPSNSLTIKEAVTILKKLPSGTGKAVFAILWAEASKNPDRTAFKSAGGYNYAGVQTDGGKWGAPGIIGQYCRVDSGGNKRAFAIFENNETFLKFMADRVEKKGFNGNNGDDWTTTYINSWWSPAAKASYTKGTEKYNSKLSIYNTAMKKWNAN
jgi:hypothetical protein